MTLSRDTFGHDDEIGRLFEEYDRLVRWEEHNSRLDATDPVVERAAARGRIVAFIANTATLQQDAHTSMNAEPEPQDVGDAREGDTEYDRLEREWVRLKAANEQAIRADERKRWAEREQQLVEALTTSYRELDEALTPWMHGERIDPVMLVRAMSNLSTRAVLNQERPA